MSIIPDNVRGYVQNGHNHPWANKEAMTFSVEFDGPQGKEKRVISYHKAIDHHTCLLEDAASQETIARAKQQEDVGANWAVIAEMIRRIPLTAIAGGYGLHLLGVDLPLIGGGMTATKWGIAAGLTLPLGPITPALALAHTFVTGGRFLGPQGLFIRGSVMYGMGIISLDFTYKRARHHTLAGWNERVSLSQKYRQKWQGIADQLKGELEKSIRSGSDLTQVKRDAELLLKQEQTFTHIYGLNISHYRAILRPVCERILAFDPSKVTPEENGELATIHRRLEDKQRNDYIPQDIAQRFGFLSQLVNALQQKHDSTTFADDPGGRAQQRRSQVALDATKDACDQIKKLHEQLQECGKSLDALAVDLSRKSVALLQRLSAQNIPNVLTPSQGNGFGVQANRAQEQCAMAVPLANQEGLLADPKTVELLRLRGDVQLKQREYDAFNPDPSQLKRAVVVVSLLKNSSDQWSEGAVITKRWEGAQEKLALLEKGMLDLKEFIVWAEERAFPEYFEHGADSYAQAHRLWDAYCHRHNVPPLPPPR